MDAFFSVFYNSYFQSKSSFSNKIIASLGKYLNGFFYNNSIHLWSRGTVKIWTFRGSTFWVLNVFYKTQLKHFLECFDANYRWWKLFEIIQIITVRNLHSLQSFFPKISVLQHIKNKCEQSRTIINYIFWKMNIWK